MARYRNALLQLGGGLFLTDGGIETTLIFQEGLELPDFAAFHLLKDSKGEAALGKYFRTYAEIAKRFGTGLVLESATWRASADWGTRLGYTPEALAQANRKAIRLLEEIRSELANEKIEVVISGCLGPRGDGYSPAQTMSDREAEAYHREQVETFADTAADMVTAITMNYVEEAIGIARAAESAGMPVVISFTVETDGRLPTGQTLRAAIEQVDAANASRKSHAELNESPELDVGDPVELGMQHARLKQRLPQLNVLGGCCGTDHRHVEQIAAACLPFFQTATHPSA